MGTGSFPGVKRPGLGVDHPPPSSDEVKRKSRAIPLFPLWIIVACYRVNVTFTFNSLDKPFCNIKWHPWKRANNTETCGASEIINWFVIFVV
jgi:hypothetical protein